MAIKRNKKDYGWNENCQPVFLRIMDQKTGRNKILGWFASKAEAKRKVYSFVDEYNHQIFDPSNYGRAWSMISAKDVENSKYPFGKQYDVLYHIAYEDMLFSDQYSLVH